MSVAVSQSSKLEELFQRKSTLGIIVAMALPTVASQLIGVIYNYADSIYVGTLNKPEQIAAIALALPTSLIMLGLANFWGVGAGSMLSRALGKKDFRTAGRISAFSTYCATGSSLLLGRAGGRWGGGLIRFLGASETVLPYAREYFLWFFTLGVVPSVLSMHLSNLLRAEGYARLASRGLILGGILNVILDPFFIFPFGLGLGVGGAAFATFLSNVISTLFLAGAIYRIRSQSCLSFRPSLVRMSSAEIREILSVGLPSALIMFLSAISNNVLNVLLARHGDHVVAAIGIAKKADFLPSHIAVGITQGALPLIAYAYASGKHEKMKDILFTTLKMAFYSLTTLVIFLEIFARPMSLLFIRDEETVRFAATFIQMLCISFPLYAVSTTINAFYQAINRPQTALILSIIRKGPLDIPLMILLGRFSHFTNIAWSQFILDLITVIICLIVVKRFFASNVFRKDIALNHE
ncbi:MAG: polysaccharide biosynthesis C-terminal domain-containing protein [Lentisphaeria bacterium]|nr:polysaccharide biosynthesis C-terminal domain-containing protein [Lentisphaeria bacterium]